MKKQKVTGMSLEELSEVIPVLTERKLKHNGI